MESCNSIFVLLGVLAVSIIAAQIYLRYKKKNYTQATDVDKAMWEIYAMSMAFGVAIYFFVIFLPAGPYDLPINTEDTLEAKIQKLIDRDNKKTEYLEKLKDSEYFLMFAVGLYLMLVGGFVGRIQKKRDERLLIKDPENKKPLGL